MNPKQIVIDGKVYNSVNEMPEDVRRNYEDAMRNSGAGTAGNIVNPVESLGNLSGGMKYVVDGNVYNSVDDLPPEARARYEQAMGSMDKNRNGVPDFLEGMMNVSMQGSQAVTPSASQPMETPRRSTGIPFDSTQDKSGSSAITPETSSGWMLVGAGALLLLLCAVGAIGVWYFFLR